MRLVGSVLPSLRPDDQLYLKLKDSRKDVLTRRFDGVRARLIDGLRQLVEIRYVASAPYKSDVASQTSMLLEYMGGSYRSTSG